MSNIILIYYNKHKIKFSTSKTKNSYRKIPFEDTLKNILIDEKNTQSKFESTIKNTIIENMILYIVLKMYD